MNPLERFLAQGFDIKMSLSTSDQQYTGVLNPVFGEHGSRRYLLLAVLWTLLIVLSAGYGAYTAQRNAVLNAQSAAIASVNKDMSFRRWVTSHGGVYVEPSEHTPVNPYLHHPERDLITKEGKHLTLVNPAYALRNMLDNYPDEFGIRTHLTSLKLLNPDNHSDQWEYRALQQFEIKAVPVEALSEIDGEPYYRYMKPFIVEQMCLKCHAQQGYHLNDVRGGISTSVPMSSYYEQRNIVWWQLGITHAIIWLLGLVGLWITYRRTQIFNQERHAHIYQLQETEALYRSITDNGQSLIWMSDVHHERIFFNRPWLNFTGLATEQALMHWQDAIHPDDQQHYHQEMQAASAHQQPYQLTYRLKNRDGYYHWILDECAPRYNAKGDFVGYIGQGLDISDLKEAEAKISMLTNFDNLTRLPNRRMMMAQLQESLHYSTHNGCYGALILIDLDNFKSLNDTLGHDKGDELLKQVAQRLQSLLPKQQSALGRLGGDEFMMLAGVLHEDETLAIERAGSLAQRIVESFQQPFRLQSQTYQTTASVGVVLFYGDFKSVDTLLQHAEVAMYQAKEAGRNTLRFFDPHMQEAVSARSALEHDLRQALRQQAFMLYAQPQVNAQGCTLGVELLLRWQHPQRGMVSPATFIPLAEEMGLIIPLGEWVLWQACQLLARWQTDARWSKLRVAVNVSAHQFKQEQFVQQLQHILTETGAPAALLELELTESVFVADSKTAIDKMLQLKQLGVRFSLDDFGTGYSSLSYLKRLPLDQLKIDQGFVRDLLVDDNDRVIARTIITLADSLGLDVIAEGVETQEQQALLAQMGCFNYQGYWFARPQPIRAIEEHWLVHATWCEHESPTE